MNPLKQASNQIGVNQWLDKGAQFVSKNEWKTSTAAQKALDKLNQTLEGHAYLVQSSSGNLSVALDKKIYHYFEKPPLSNLKNPTMNDCEIPKMSIEKLLQNKWPSFLEKKFEEVGTSSMGTSASYSISEVEVDGEKKYRITQNPAHYQFGKPPSYEIDLNTKEYEALQSKVKQKARNK